MASGLSGEKKPASVRLSMVLSFAEKYTGLLIGLPTIMIVSRLLTPAEIGVFSVAMAVMTLMQMLRHFGVTDFIVQDNEAGPEVIRSAFTMSIVISWLLGVALYFASAPIADFYGDPGVGRVLRVLSAVFLLMPYSSIMNAILQRHMEFGALYKINTTENIVRSGFTIGLAYAGFSYMSLAWAALASMVATSLSCMYWGRHHGFHGIGFARWQEIGRFGVACTLQNLFNKMGQFSADIIVGRMLGMAAAGLYSRGYGLVNMFRTKVIGAINNVAFPTFSRGRIESDSAGYYFLRFLTYVTAVAWPFLLFSAFMAFPAIRLFFGPQWTESVPLLRWLALAAIFGTLTYQCNLYFTAIGRVDLAMTREAGFQSARVVITIVAALYSLEAVAAAQIVVYAVGISIYYPTLAKYGNVSARAVVRALAPSFWVTLCAGAGPAAVYFFFTPNADRLWLPLFLAGATAGLGWLAGIYWVRHPLRAEVGLLLRRLPRGAVFRSATRHGA